MPEFAAVNSEIAACWKLVWNVEPAPLIVPLAAAALALAGELAVADEPVDVVELDDEHAASVVDATRSTAGAHSALLTEPLISESFQFEPE